jgi:rhamnulokinase
MVEHYLAFDLGAESGRAFLGALDDNGSLKISELHVFPNGMVNVRDSLHWDTRKLYEEMLNGMRICAGNHTKSPASIGIDTWGVDFALLDAQGILTGEPFAYRDRRHQKAMEEFLSKMPSGRLYQLTGIQLLPINSVFQLYAMALEQSSQLMSATDLLFIPDLFNYFFTGIKKSEFTIATTSQLYNPVTAGWDAEIFEHLGIAGDIMQEIVPPGTTLGNLAENIVLQTGLDRVPVVATASHDTAAAIAAVPATGKNFAYISSGTWSCMGIESPTPVIDEKTLKYNITNEGGVCGTFRLLKNIMGLWLLQECKREWSADREYTYSDLIDMAEKSVPLGAIIDPDRPQFLNPASMILAIREFCQTTEQPIPQEIGQFVQTILQSLALAYRYVLEQLSEISSQEITQIHIIGGGSQNHLLCQLTADITGLPVYAGPVEATAIGNILVQAMASGRISSLEELRKVVRQSFRLNLYEPQHTADWDETYERFVRLKQKGAK